MPSSTIAVTERREKYRAAVRSEILKGARAIFIHEGYASFSLRRLAAEIGYSPAAIYKHFKSKAEIFECLVEESFTALSDATANVKPMEGEDFIELLKRGMWAYVEFGLANPDHYRFAFLLPPPSNGTRLPRQRASYTRLRERVQKCIDADRFYGGDSELMAQSLWAAVHGVTSLLVQKPAFPWVGRRRLIARVIDSAVAGLLMENQ